MVRALLAGIKTQTRRVMKPNIRCLYGMPGDQLWVRETWAAPHAYDHLPPRLIPQDARIHYAATEERGGLLWRPSIHMPRFASRITLEVTEVRVERLQDISYGDALAEGIYDFAPAIEEESKRYGLETGEQCTRRLRWPQRVYERLWNNINGPGSWDANPFVLAISFRRAGAA